MHVFLHREGDFFFVSIDHSFYFHLHFQQSATEQHSFILRPINLELGRHVPCFNTHFQCFFHLGLLNYFMRQNVKYPQNVYLGSDGFPQRRN